MTHPPAAKLRAVLDGALLPAFDTPHVVFLLAAHPEHAKPGHRCRGRVGAGRLAAEIVLVCCASRRTRSKKIRSR